MKLTVYVCIDLIAPPYDIELIQKAIHVCLVEKMRDDNIQVMVVPPLAKRNTTYDLIENGLMQMQYITRSIQTDSQEIWTLYLTTGDLLSYTNVTLLLLNKQPSKRKCMYTIHKQSLDLFSHQTKDIKLQKIKTLSASITELFSGANNVFEYKDYLSL